MKVGKELGDSIERIRRDNTIVTSTLEPWLLAHANDQIPAWVWDKITIAARKLPYDARGRFTGSGAATCHRRQLLRYLGASDGGFNSARLNLIFLDGTWRHLRLQAMMLMAGIIDDIEVHISYPLYHVSGSMDGSGTVPMDHKHVTWRGLKFGLEIKGTNPWVYQTLGDTGWKKYKYQVARYFLMANDIELFVFFVENKATQETKEWVIRREDVDQLIADDKNELEKLNGNLRAKKMPSLLPGCKIQKGDIWKECPFGGVDGACYRAGDWPHGTTPRLRRVGK